MKIGILRRQYHAWGGGERFTQRFVQALTAGGHEVHLFCHGWRDPPGGVRVHRVPRLGAGALGMLGFAAFAPRLARRTGVDLVHSFDRALRQDIFRAGEGCHREWLALRARGRGPGVGEVGFRPMHRAVLMVERAIARGGATRVLEVNSQMVHDDFRRRYGALRPRVELVRNAVDHDRFAPESREARRGAARAALAVGDALVLVTVGSGLERKGLPATIRALPRLARAAGTRVVLLVCGKVRETTLAALTGAAGVSDRVQHLGQVEDLTDVYAAADVFVLPTVYDPASNATLEALAMGLPVVTTTRNGASEIVEHDKSAWLLDDPADVDGLTALLVAAADRHARERIGAAGQQAVAPWTWERHVGETLTLYASLR